jgi:hypothetical protein
MNLKNPFIPLGLALLVVLGFNAYAVDTSVCKSGVNVVLHDNGALRSCELKDDYEANNVRCNKGSVSFYNNGNLESCMLSRATTIGENRCDPVGLISFYPDGKLKSCMKPAN